MTTHPHVEELDHRYTSWDIYRTADKRWICRLSHPPIATVEGDTIEACLAAAVAYVDLPVIPRKPTVYALADFEPYKNGSKWRLRYQGRDFCVQTNTKREALASAEMLASRSCEAYQAWCDKYGLIHEQGTEGVDFRYS